MDELDPRPSIQGQDEDRLAELGYKQELTRNWSLLHNFGVSFSIIVRLRPHIFFFFFHFFFHPTNQFIILFRRFRFL